MQRTTKKSSGFWHNVLQKPIIGLSPMDGVSDHPFRHVTKKYGKPAVMYTEFASVEGICHGSTTFRKEFLYDQTQRPIVAQIFGTEPKCFYQATILACELGFDGIDINMGCPAKNVAHRGAGAGLIRTPELAAQVVRSVQQAALDWSAGATLADCPDIPTKSRRLVELMQADTKENTPARQRIIPPVSIKTRIGYDTPCVPDWIGHLLTLEPAAIALHGRTLKQQYGGVADWEQIGRAAELAATTDTLFLGNGDISSLSEAIQKTHTYRLDGALIGRASFGNPFVFIDEDNPILTPISPERQQLRQLELAQVALEHALLFERTYAPMEKYSFMPMRKHLGWYIRGIANAKEVRTTLFQTNTAAEVREILQKAGLLPNFSSSVYNSSSVEQMVA